MTCISYAVHILRAMQRPFLVSTSEKHFEGDVKNDDRILSFPSRQTACWSCFTYREHCRVREVISGLSATCLFNRTAKTASSASELRASRPELEQAVRIPIFELISPNTKRKKKTQVPCCR